MRGWKELGSASRRRHNARVSTFMLGWTESERSRVVNYVKRSVQCGVRSSAVSAGQNMPLTRRIRHSNDCLARDVGLVCVI